MSPARTLENNKYEVGESRTSDPSFGGYIALSTGLQGHLTIAWWVGRLLLSMACVGSIASVINLFLCEKGSEALDLNIVRGEGRAPWITVTKPARINEVGDIYFVGDKVLSSGLQSNCVGQLTGHSNQQPPAGFEIKGICSHHESPLFARVETVCRIV